jgi:subtilisin family serine protease
LGRGSFVLAVLLALFSVGVAASEPLFVPGRLLIKPRSSINESNLAARLGSHGARHSHKLAHSNVRVVDVPLSRMSAAMAALRKDSDIEFVERDGVGQAAFVPDDSLVVLGTEWHLAKIMAPAAWDYSTGSNVIVAVLDSGINAAHPEFAGRILPGYNFVSATSDCSDDFGHGTAVAGTVGAAGNNDMGVAGIAFGCSILPVKVVDWSGFAAYSDIASGIYYAVDHGARVINISVAGDSPSATLQAAIDYAWSNNVVVVAAAGNNSNDTPQYPAACSHAVAVSATEATDSLAVFSSFGSYVTVSAPGDNIWTTQRDLSNPYGPWRGTSFASPIAAGIIALALSANPSLSNEQLVSLLRSTSDDLGATGYDVFFGAGRVNAFNCVAGALQLAGQSVSALPQTNSVPGGAPPPAINTNGLTFPLFPKTSHYAGLIANTNNVTIQSSGGFAVSVRPSGVFTGRAFVAGRRYGLRGQFDTNGRATVIVSNSAGVLNFLLTLNGTDSVDAVSGTVTSGAWTASLSADRNVFNSQLNPAPQAGVRGFILERADTLASAAAGAGHISKSGHASMHGKLSDGRSFSSGSTLSLTGDYPFYLSMHRGSEIVIGWISFSAARQAQTAGTVVWLNSGTNTFARELVAASAP